MIPDRCPEEMVASDIEWPHDYGCCLASQMETEELVSYLVPGRPRLHLEPDIRTLTTE
jgi:hypothetical protein